ncbi:hypothetical protein Cgig2_025252 [Carnegiea gigantea]|uniref:Uncharacterized protein n=1 Tax=Carnegiea gigantea TaxID=171969 RepID=A0A9Q1JGI4_9CARY|nr:hypothetical protein Cgig2_025252 [Carnegiea gigantea]
MPERVKGKDEGFDRSFEKPQEEKEPSDKSATNLQYKERQMAPPEQPLKYEKGDNEKRMYQKTFITRISICSFSSMMARLNEAQIEAIRSMGFASFLKVDLKQIPGKFSKWLVESFDPHSASFVRSKGQRFIVTVFDVYVTLVLPIGGSKIMEITRSSADEEYNEVHAVWLKEWKIEHNTLELTYLPEFILVKKDSGESFMRNFIIYLVNCFFSGPKSR